MIGSLPKSAVALSSAATASAPPPRARFWSATSSSVSGTPKPPLSRFSAKASPSPPSEALVELCFFHTPTSIYSSVLRSRNLLLPSSRFGASRSSSGTAVCRSPSARGHHPNASASRRPTPSSPSRYSTSASSAGTKRSMPSSAISPSPNSATATRKPSLRNSSR